MRRIVTACLVALIATISVVTVIVIAWTFDARAHRGRVVRNVVLAGVRIGGDSPAQLAAAVRRVALLYRDAPIVVSAPDGGFRTDAATLGVAINTDASAHSALAAGRTGSLAARIGGWIGSFFHSRRVPVRIAVRTAAVYREVAAKDPGPRTAAVEPTIKKSGHRLQAVEGKVGRGIDPRDLVRALPRAAATGLPITVHVGRGEVAPRFTTADARKAADDGETLAAVPLQLAAGPSTAKATVDMIRSWLTTTAGDDGLMLGFDINRMTTELGKLMPAAGTPPVETSFTVVGTTPQVVEGQPGTTCCAGQSADLLMSALRARRKDPVTLPLTKVEPSLTKDAANALGIKEQVSTFTTKHPCCAPRVSNIHRIADLVRGVVIKPDETFSVNAFVGPRTAAKGFLVDHVIEEGKFAEAVGGGISQFGTTSFNAAFFAGLSIPEYQAHSIYISRYPYGREATLSYPHPDVKIHNTSPYGVLIWTSYTGTSLTVSFYSTHWVDVTQSGQTTGPRGPCTSVKTERTRKFLDGTTKIDHFSALYQPAEGILCN